MTHILRSLRHRNYRLFFGGQGLSLIGTWMQSAALPWMVFALTKPVYGKTMASLLLGIVAFASQILAFGVAPFAGVLADRWDRKRVLVLTQTLSMLQALLVALVAFAPTAGPGVAGLTVAFKVGAVIALGAFLGLVNGFDIPVRQAFVVEMLDRREDLSNAIAMNSMLFNGARIIGPAVAGLLIYKLNIGMCFLINAVSYGAVIAALLAMRVRAPEKHIRHPHVLHSLKEGFAYAFGSAPIRSLLLLLSVVSLVGMSYGTLMPAFADLLGVGAQPYGLLFSAAGAGALLGAVFLAARRSVLGLGWWIGIGPALFGAGLIGFGFSQAMWLSLPLLVVVGFGIMVQMASSNTILQTIVDDDKRGRVMSFWTMSFMGTAPFGALLAGSLASGIGPRLTVVLSGVTCIFASAAFFTRLPGLRKAVRPIYVRMGIITPQGNCDGPVDLDPHKDV